MKAGNRILIIDDDIAVRQTLCENLRDSGFEVLEASNGVHGLMMLDRFGFPDVIITDIIMPGLGGVDTIREIRSKNAGVKVVAISGGGRTETGDFLELAKRMGADASFAKPIDLDKLEATIKAFVA